MTEKHSRLRILIHTPPGGFGEHRKIITNWLDQKCGVDGWSMALADSQGTQNEAIEIYLNNLTCALAFLARWCLPDCPSGIYELRANPRRGSSLSGEGRTPVRREASGRSASGGQRDRVPMSDSGQLDQSRLIWT